MPREKFIQPAEGVELLSEEERVTLSPYELEIGRQRVAAGEDIDSVALDLAIRESAILNMKDLKDDE